MSDDPNNPFDDDDSPPISIPVRRKRTIKDPFHPAHQGDNDPFAPSPAQRESDIDRELNEPGPGTRDA